jgi:DNA-binding MarR family transcriptional regulator
VPRSRRISEDGEGTGAGSDRDAFDAAWSEFLGAVRRARGRAIAEIEREGLSLPQYHLLAALGEGSGGMPVGALAEAAGVAQPTATRMLDGLEREGVVVRRPSDADRRSVTVELTSRGRLLVRRKQKLVDARRSAVYESLRPSDRRAAVRVLRAMAASIEDGR